ncbi:hypothetical protein M3J09_011721 [Ascochyta lentis]
MTAVSCRAWNVAAPCEACRDDDRGR